MCEKVRHNKSISVEFPSVTLSKNGGLYFNRCALKILHLDEKRYAERFIDKKTKSIGIRFSKNSPSVSSVKVSKGENTGASLCLTNCLNKLKINVKHTVRVTVKYSPSFDLYIIQVPIP